MRYGIFSDIHANLEAFEAVMAFYEKERIDAFIFIGDSVGYGANPHEALALLRQLNPICIAGNHDWAAIDTISTDNFSTHAAAAIEWTKTALDEADREFINTFKLHYHEQTCCYAHGSLDKPETFEYVLNISDARRNFSLMRQQLLFVGHSHKMQVYVHDRGQTIYQPEMDIPIVPECRYIINVGSVGQPRDRDPRACCVLYDSDKRCIQLKRLAYNIKKAASKIIERGLPEILANRLFMGW